MNNTPVIPKLRVEPIRGAMASRGVTSYDELAELLGLSRATVIRIMCGKQNPTQPFTAGIHVRLSLPYDLFLDHGEQMRAAA
ncbi:helix-turn-helix domain-containing protein [Prescottella equi]|uniref:helix-turn-helix domain-containing protein n=1 Tax=Rhodococcus hoagii TaxID=43767 RepID=UPI00111C0F34|nr:helix-turn-helix transcriptional regulator [Prescottella equi]